MKVNLAVVLCGLAGGAMAQTWPVPPPALQQALTRAELRNPGLGQSERMADAADAQGDAAASALRPRVDAKTRYSRAEGGRTIDFPVGDLLNPVYGTLGQITGQPDTFPSVENQSIAFLRETEQETKLAAYLPLYRPALRDQVRAARLEAGRVRTNTGAVRRAIRAETALSYHRLIAADAAVGILASAGGTLEQAWKTTEALVREGRATPDAAARARAERLGVDQQRREAEQARDTALAAFNVLLDDPLTNAAPVITEADWLAYAERLAALTNTLATAARVEAREEIVAAKAAVEAARARLAAARRSRLPGVDLAGEYGWQGEQYDLDDEHDYGIVSVLAEVPLFDGHERRSRAAAARAEVDALEFALQDARRRVELEIDDAARAFRVALTALPVAAERVDAARQALESTTVRYREGRVQLVSFLDARDALTRAQLDAVGTRARLFMAATRYERAAALDLPTQTAGQP
jgi:outer membrane protein TolC